MSQPYPKPYPKPDEAGWITLERRNIKELPANRHFLICYWNEERFYRQDLSKVTELQDAYAFSTEEILRLYEGTWEDPREFYPLPEIGNKPEPIPEDATPGRKLFLHLQNSQTAIQTKDRTWLNTKMGQLNKSMLAETYESQRGVYCSNDLALWYALLVGDLELCLPAETRSFNELRKQIERRLEAIHNQPPSKTRLAIGIAVINNIGEPAF